MKICLATTTINVPTLLLEYAKDAQIFCSEEIDIEFVVAGDRKTPDEVPEFLRTIEDETKINIQYLSVETQQNMLSNHSALKTYLDLDCIQRRNLAGLYSYWSQSDYTIYIDDDNLIAGSGYFKWHIQAVSGRKSKSVHNSLGFHNIMEGNLGQRSGDWLFPRGFPFGIRNIAQKSIEVDSDHEVCVNAGLWIEEPDIDAASRIAGRPVIEEYAVKNSQLVLKPGTWTPINSQNTCISTALLPSYFLSSKVGRYDDIYAGYILQKIAQHFDLAVSFGEPIVRQERNVHVLLKDLDLEREGMECIDFFVDLLKSFDLSGSTVIELMFNFLEHLEATLLSISRNHFAFKTIAELHTGYSLWINALVEPTDWRR